jgi:hypothetical protein
MQSGEYVVTYWVSEGYTYTVIHYGGGGHTQPKYIQHMVQWAHQLREQQLAADQYTSSYNSHKRNLSKTVNTLRVILH